MNKGNLNKLVTNYPVSLTNEEVENLSLTLSAVRTAGGGGGEGKTYTGEGYVSVNNTNNTISLTTEAVEKLNQPIPTKVSDLTDSANYQTTAGMASYETTQHASQIYLTKSSADTLYAPLSTTADIDALKAVSGDFSLYYKKTETSSKEALETAFESKQDNLTQEQLSAISSVSSIKGTVLVGDSNILAASADDGNNIKWTLELTAQPTVTDTTLSGYDGIVATKDSSVSSQWNVGIAQAYKEQIDAVSSKLTEASANTLYAPISVTGDVDTLKSSSGNWNKVSDKLNTTAFSTVSGNFLTAHQSLEDYATKSDINDMATTTWVGEQGFYTKASGDNDYAPKSVTSTINTLTGASAGWNDVTAKLDKSIYANASGNWEASYNVLTAYSAAGKWLTAHQSLTNYYTKSETSGAGELSTEFAKYVTSSNVTTPSTDYVMTTTGWKVLTLPGGGMTQVIHDDTLTGQGNADNSKLGLSQTAYNAITSVSSKLDTTAFSDVSGTFLTKSSADNDYAPLSVTATVNTLTAASARWDEVSAKLGTAQYANDSATFVTKPDTTQTVLNNNYLIYSTLTDPTATTGWMPLSANYYSKTEADGRYQKKEDMSNYLTTAKYETDSATFVTSSSNTITGTKQYALTTTGWSDIGLSAYLPLSGGTVSGELVVSGGGNFDTQFLKITRENVNGYGRIGLGSSGPLALKVDDANSHTTQINISPNTTNDQLVQVQHNGNQVGFLIPAVTATTTAGLTDDGILHIILES
jgi:hypothetical protein